MKKFLSNTFGAGGSLAAEKEDAETVEFWDTPDRAGWLMKQGEHLKTWRKRWFVLKQGKIFWFKSDGVSKDSVCRGCLDVSKCLSVRGAEDAINKPFAFEISSSRETMFFVAETNKDKEDWINSIGRAIVHQSSSLLEKDDEIMNY